MKNTILNLISILMLWLPFGGAAQEVIAENPAIIPQPAEILWKEGVFTLPEKTVVCYNSEAKASAAWLQQLLKNTNTQSFPMEGEDCLGFSLKIDKTLKESLGDEGYKLNITENKVSLLAATEAGLFYAIQSLRQMFPAEIETEKISGKIKLKQVAITDVPKYEWRGTMIDISRSFFGPEYIKKHLDRMAFYKLNRLHLHLTDDQGWRIEIKQLPKLTEVGSKGAVKGGRSGFLTQDEYKDIQEYAAARNIIIIPEIDMPGHNYSALMAYPELNCDEFANLTPARATPPALYHEYNVGWSKFCLENPETYDFVATVMGEMAEITEGPWLHIGGDEIEDPLYEEFMVKADSIVRGLGKTTIGWEEATKAEVDSSFISQRWHGEVESVVDVKVIESICSSFYFDHANVEGQESTNNWCKEDGVSLKNVYDFKSDNPSVLGVEAPVWTEMVLSDSALDDRFWPRSIALAEVGWSKTENRKYKDFLNRLGKHGERLDRMKVDYYRTPEVNWNSERSNGVFSGFIPFSK